MKIEHYYIERSPWFFIQSLSSILGHERVKNALKLVPAKHKRTITIPGLPQGNPKRAFVDRIGLCMIAFRYPNQPLHEYLIFDLLPKFSAYSSLEYRMTKFFEAVSHKAGDPNTLNPVQAFRLYHEYVNSYASITEVREHLARDYGYVTHFNGGLELWVKTE